MIADDRTDTYCPFTMSSDGLPKLCLKEKCEAWEPGCEVWNDLDDDDEACYKFQETQGKCLAEISFKYCRGFCHRIHNALELKTIQDIQEKREIL